MRVTFCLRAEDYYEARNALLAMERRLRWLAALVLALIMVVYALRSGVAIVLLLIFLIASLSIFECLDRLNYKRICKNAALKAQQKELTLGISEEGLQSGDGTLTEPWSYYSSYSESANVFVLYHAKMISIILPKRAFDSGDLDSFRQTLDRRVTHRA
jgi:hypothetical protein